MSDICKDHTLLHNSVRLWGHHCHLCDGAGVGLVLYPLLLDWDGVLNDPDGASGSADKDGATCAGDGDGRVYCLVSAHLL